MNPSDGDPLTDRLGGLRRRLIHSVMAVGAGFALCYAYSEELLHLLVWPLKRLMTEGEKLIFTGLVDMFFTYLKIALVGGLLLAAPYLFYQTWMCVAPDRYRGQKRLLASFLLSSTLLFAGGALFGYFVVFPYGFRFFLSFETEYLQALPSVRHYFSLCVKLLFAFGLIFELPVAAYFLSRTGVASASFLGSKRRYAILGSFVLAALLTPPDVVSQFLMAIPMILLYEVGILVARVGGRQRERAIEE
ncbi:MAG: twin-arginine translocase subunit TatC [Thermodesulfobacteriota bacterium]